MWDAKFPKDGFEGLGGIKQKNKLKRLLTVSELSGKKAKGCKVVFIRFNYKSVGDHLYAYTNPANNSFRYFTEAEWKYVKEFGLPRFNIVNTKKGTIKAPPNNPAKSFAELYFTAYRDLGGKNNMKPKLERAIYDLYIKKVVKQARLKPNKKETTEHIKRAKKTLKVGSTGLRIQIGMQEIFTLSNTYTELIKNRFYHLSVPIIFYGDKPTAAQIQAAEKQLQKIAALQAKEFYQEHNDKMKLIRGAMVRLVNKLTR